MINKDLAYKIWKIRHGDPMYCFPLRMFLGERGLIENHPLKGKTFIDSKSGVEFNVDNVYAHWYQGWYMLALAQNKDGSHVQINWDINSDYKISNIENYTLKNYNYNFETNSVL